VKEGERTLDLIMLRRIGLLLAISLGACQARPLSKTDLPGKYELRIGTNQQYRRHDFTASMLQVNADGTFEQTCSYNSTAQAVARGKWELSSGGRDIHFERFLDCAGMWPESWTGIGATLLLEGGAPPLILLDPDINIYYAPI
jgi:hypothetical protein